MMKKISEGYCNHIVNMVGCVTLQEPLCLITEFVPHGDLLEYLRSQRKKVHRASESIHPPLPVCLELSEAGPGFIQKFDLGGEAGGGGGGEGRGGWDPWGRSSPPPPR